MNKTSTPSLTTIKRNWFLVDANGQTLGRLASEIANVLRKVAREVVEKNSKNIKVTKKTIIDKSNVNNKILKKGREDVIDVCSILDRCNIEEISKYLIKEGKNKKFPNITMRE